MCLRPALRPRRDQRYRNKAIAATRHGPTHSVPRGLSTRGNFGALSHGISTRCLRFAVRISPPHARLASGCGLGSTRRDWLPAGFLRKVSEMLLTSLPPFPSFLAQTLSPLCAVKKKSRRSSVGETPTRHRSLQPVAIGAAVEVTKLPKPSMERVALGDSASSQAVT